ncbi:MAG: hypothetical protein R3Y51_05885 [Rikenellaceae bacterium]
MIDYILSKYCSHVDDQVEDIKSNIKNNEYLELHVEFLEKRYKRFSLAYRIRGYITKFTPVLMLLLLMLYPSKRMYYWYIPIALLVIVISEVAISKIFPVTYFNKIHGNITILKGFIRHNKTELLNNNSQ